jgi:hypothetical protein
VVKLLDIVRHVPTGFRGTVERESRDWSGERFVTLVAHRLVSDTEIMTYEMTLRDTEEFEVVTRTAAPTMGGGGDGDRTRGNWEGQGGNGR